ncbi:ABC transporter ATP-binding protein [Clostridium oceanicum]|uniref:Energy-coupling factor transporter ATPase n=1 Tax=Clostridium oceanicum TaxID=1543 RepID=A0ABN1JEV2_9CLOT
MNSFVEFKNVSFNYLADNKKVLNNVSFSIKENKINIFIGKSGCGKSTIAKCISGIIPNLVQGDIEGKIIYKNKNIIGESTSNLCREFGYVFQNPDCQFCTFTVEDEIAFGLENLNIDRNKIEKRIEEVLDIIDIKHIRHKDLNLLSGGEKQKVAIASILAIDPKCLILDEPTANLDPKSTVEIFNILKRLRDIHKKTIILIEHKLDYIFGFVDEVIYFSDSKILSGSVDYVLNSICNKNNSCYFMPRSVYISKILKENNLLDKYLYKKTDIVESLINIYKKNKIIKERHIRNKNKTVLSVNNLNFSYHNKSNSLTNINLDIKLGDFTCILGHNGAGKSTLTKVLLGLYKNYDGSILIDGKNLKDYSRLELTKKIGLVFQNPEHQFVANTVFEELGYSLKNHGEKEELIKEKVDLYLKKFNLYNMKNANPYLLSEGEKRRLSVASMLITGQEILILDEPTFGQDIENTIELMNYMKSINKSGVTVIIISHDMDMVVKYCDKSIVLKEGKILFNGYTKSLFKSIDVVYDAKLQLPFLGDVCREIRKNIKDFPMLINEEDLKTYLGDESVI